MVVTRGIEKAGLQQAILNRQTEEKIWLPYVLHWAMAAFIVQWRAGRQTGVGQNFDLGHQTCLQWIRENKTSRETNKTCPKLPTSPGVRIHFKLQPSCICLQIINIACILINK